MIAYHISISKKKIQVEDSHHQGGMYQSLPELFEFLLDAPAGEFNVFWDLESLFEVVQKFATEEQLKSIPVDGTATFAGYKIIYNPNKNFFLKSAGRWVSYYHLKQYFKDVLEEPSLDELQRLGEQILSELATIGVFPKKLSSCIAMFEGIFDKFPLPTFKNIPDMAGDFSTQCVGQDWVEAHKIGYFDRVVDYDQRGAYPYAVANLLDTRYGIWNQSPNRPAKAVYGWAYTQVYIDAQVSPIRYLNKDRYFYSPTGQWEKTLLLQEMDCIDELKLGKYRIFDGIWWTPRSKVYPLQLIMHKIFGERQNSKLLNTLIKGASVGIWGRFGFRKMDGTFGDQYNPVWQSVAETEPRLKDAYFIYNNHLEENLVGVTTDGVMSTLDVPLTDVARLGAWRKDSEGPALVLDSDSFFYGNKKPHNLTFNQAVEMVKENPKSTEWSSGNKGFKLRLPIEHDRMFAKVSANGDDLLNHVYDSTPIKSSKLSKPTLNWKPSTLPSEVL